MSLPTAPPPPPDFSVAVLPTRVGEPAGFWIRAVAAGIDGLIQVLMVAVVWLFFGFLAAYKHQVSWLDMPAKTLAMAAYMFFPLLVITVPVAVLTGWLYEALMTRSQRGATLGKLAVGIRVVGESGGRLTFGHATGRHFSKYVTALVPLLIGYIMAGVTDRKRALHDMLASTLVVKKRSVDVDLRRV
jgi:uncharacterized RDD family membrane protein YckC